MQSFRVVAIPTEVAAAVRSTRTAPGYGHPAHAEVARGYGPCRHCLRTFEIGQDRRILFTLDSFRGIEPLPLPGPVFVHEEDCARYAEDGGMPADLLNIPMTLNAYARGRRLVAQEYARGDAAGAAASRLLNRSDVDYVHVHNTEAGCFMFRIEHPGLPAANAW